jgi:outer membrane protein assembly factor BamD (BamD/ComL family)
MEQNIVETPFLFRASAWADKNRKPLIYGIVGVAVAGLVIGYTVWSKKQQEIAAGQALSRAFYEQATGRMDAAAAVEAMMKVATANMGTPAGGQALLLAGSGLFNSGKHAEAQAAFERFKREYSGSPQTAQAMYGVGAALAAQGKLDEAARAYKESADRYPQSPVAMQAQYSLAAALAAQGKLEEALPLYEKVAGVAMGNSLGNEAVRRAEELRAKLPPPALLSPAATAIPTNAVPAQP